MIVNVINKDKNEVLCKLKMRKGLKDSTIQRKIKEYLNETRLLSELDIGWFVQCTIDIGKGVSDTALAVYEIVGGDPRNPKIRSLGITLTYEIEE